MSVCKSVYIYLSLDFFGLVSIVTGQRTFLFRHLEALRQQTTPTEKQVRGKGHKEEEEEKNNGARRAASSSTR